MTQALLKQPSDYVLKEDDDAEDIVSKALEEFTSVVDERLTELEKKSADAKTPANDAEGLDTKAFEEVQKRLDKLEAKSARPVITGPKSPVMDEDETKAFTDYLRTGEVKALSYGSGTGGILAPETVAKTVIEKVSEFSPVRGLASSIQMAGPLLQLPRLVTEVDPAAVAEGAAKSEDEPTFEQIDLKPFEMGVIVPATKALLEDAHVDLSGYLANHIARRFGQVEASWFITGDGATQPEGVLTSAEVADNEVASFNAEALIDHFYALKTAYAANGVWMMNRTTMAYIRKFTDNDGQYLWQGGLAAGQPPTLLGRPVLEAVDMPDPDAGNTPIVFGDFATGYTIADRVNLDILRDEYTGSANGIVKFVARRRVGGRVTLGEALAKLSIAA